MGFLDELKKWAHPYEDEDEDFAFMPWCNSACTDFSDDIISAKFV